MQCHQRGAVLIGVLLAFAGCGDGNEGSAGDELAGAFPMTVSDCGRKERFRRSPSRVLTIGASAVYQLHAAGAADRIVARAGEFGTSLVGPAARAVRGAPVIDQEDPSLEPILGAGADVVVHYGLFKTTPADLRAAGVGSLGIAAGCGHAGGRGGSAKDSGPDFDDVLSDVERLGRLFGTEDQAGRTVRRLRDRLSGLRAPTGSRTAAAVHFFPGVPLSVAGDRSMADTLLQAAGLRNAFGDLDKEYAETGAEPLVERDPDVLVIAYGIAGETFDQARRRLLELPGVRRMGAVRRGRVIGIPAVERNPDINAVSGLAGLTRAIDGLR